MGSRNTAAFRADTATKALRRLLGRLRGGHHFVLRFNLPASLLSRLCGRPLLPVDLPRVREVYVPFTITALPAAGRSLISHVPGAVCLVQSQATFHAARSNGSTWKSDHPGRSRGPTLCAGSHDERRR